ncbi:microcystin degradation protein MlrC [Streptomyces sp. SID8361]|uniref:M81 family metallopeptidase n=1 Tax=Streptomyces sp. MnatMP-M27 TaxID=1839768 RepID=UPI00081DFA00|nr:M81 family metallopeptidase [Streptomyces sp. MnatMP-M27]MYU10406.1 microcystin degradation protein MlrC [Streptomyces sp. SID8361]SCF71660.1 Microcystin degradation protein MlrC, contains DUF1485 domain [Streptomyces sp. MnatMP-M27]
MRIAIAGIGTESSTFSMDTTPLEAFRRLRGHELVNSYSLDNIDLTDVAFVPVLVGAATAGGPIDPAAYDEMEAEIILGLQHAASETPVDGVYLDLHGAMTVRGRDCAEERLVRRVRETVGPGPVIAASMDPHGNMSAELSELLDIACAFRHAPHIDRQETRTRTITQLIDVIRMGRTPEKVWVRVPMLLPGERTATIAEPGRTVFGAMLPAIDKYGVIDANMWIGFYWADETRNHAAVLVTSWERETAEACATELAAQYWAARERFTITADRHGSWDEALRFVLDRPEFPCFISDSGDNVTGGSGGDIAFALTKTLQCPDVADSGIRFLFAGLHDPAACRTAWDVGVGGTLSEGIGAHTDTRYGAPVTGPWRVEELIQDPVFGGPSGALLNRGNISVSVQNERVYFVDPDDKAITPLGVRGLAPVPIDAFDVVVVKNGYLFPGQQARAGSSFMAITPGGTDLDEGRLTWTNLKRPMFPFDRDFEPTLKPVARPGRVL